MEHIATSARSTGQFKVQMPSTSTETDRPDKVRGSLSSSASIITDLLADLINCVRSEVLFGSRSMVRRNRFRIWNLNLAF